MTTRTSTTPLKGLSGHCARRLDLAVTELEKCDAAEGACQLKLQRAQDDRHENVAQVAQPALTPCPDAPAIGLSLDGVALMLALIAAAIGGAFLIGSATDP